ncbi:MAG: DUF559 domain-containing protein [Acidimicrobiales bacterium]|nr:DUF559 domain-containing protein [Acidimicrobiales bacterium]
MLPDPLLDLLRLQRGLAAQHQVREIEPDPYRRRSIYRDAALEKATSRVVRHRAVPWSIGQEVMVGVLDAGPGARLWGKAGASHWGFSRYPRLPAHVAVPRTHVRTGHRAQVHLIRDLDPADLTSHDGIPVARPERVILWLAGMWTHRVGHDLAARRTAVALDQAWRQRLIDGPFIHALAARSGGSGRSGIVVLRALLKDRPPSYQPAGSRLEERFEDIVPWVVRKDLRRQVTVDAELAIRTVDFRLDSWPLVIEINGEAFHTALTDREADAERYERLLDLGFSVLVLWEHDVWHDADLIRQVMLRLGRAPDKTPILHRPTKAPWQW